MPATPATSKRLEMLLKVTSTGMDDPFPWYGLAMEYRGLERHDDALATFTKLRAMKADYVPAYLMCGQMLEKLGKLDQAREWLTAGIEAARAKGDAHALSELQGALDALG
jgi:tetratricopeptide (TPR) repeat protein